MIFNREKFWELGGFDEKIKYAEDFALSKKVSKNKFGIVKTRAMTTNRRFAKDGHFKILKLFLSTLFNSRNKEFFEKEHGYFDN